MHNSGITIRYVNKDIGVDLPLRKTRDQHQNKLIKRPFEIVMIADGNHAFLISWVERLARSSLCLFYFHVQRCGSSREKSTRPSVPCSLEPLLLDTPHRYHEYHVTIHRKHESGWIKIHTILFNILQSEDSYEDLELIISKVRKYSE